MEPQTLDPEFVDAVEKALAQVTTRDVGPVTADRPLVDLGLDSVSMVELVLVMEDHLDVTIEPTELEGLKTFADLQEMVRALRAGGGQNG